MDADESFDEDDIYAAMDQLNGHWVRLEKELYQRAFPQALRLVLYDLTSVYFEGTDPVHLSQYGHSRDHRSDRPQIILSVATDTEGLPIHLAILRGNRNDTQTLQGLLHTLRRRFGIREATFVFDGGRSSQINLEALSAAQLSFVTRLSTPRLQRLISELSAKRVDLNGLDDMITQGLPAFAEKHPDRVELLGKALEVLKTRNEEDFEVIELKYFTCMDFVEIARFRGVSEKTVRRAHVRGKVALEMIILEMEAGSESKL